MSCSSHLNTSLQVLNAKHCCHTSKVSKLNVPCSKELSYLIQHWHAHFITFSYLPLSQKSRRLVLTKQLIRTSDQCKVTRDRPWERSQLI